MSLVLRTVSLAHSAADDTLSAAAKSSDNVWDFHGKFLRRSEEPSGVVMSLQSKRIYEFGLYRLDGAERLLWRDGEPVPLQPKVFDLLLALVERHGRLVEKEELMNVVCPDTFVEESNLASNISILRKTLGVNGQQFIETVPKRGYRFGTAVRELNNGSVESVIE